MKSQFVCASILLLLSYVDASPRPERNTKPANNPGNRYDEADSMNEVAKVQSDDTNIDTSPETGLHPDSEVESVDIVGNFNKHQYSDDGFEDYDTFFPSIRGNEDLEQYFSDIFRNIEQSLREYQNFNNQFMTDPFSDQNSYFNNMFPNSAYALAAAGPDRTHQIAAISPANPAHGLVASKKDELSAPAAAAMAPPTPVNPWFPSFPFMPNFNSFFNTATNQPNVDTFSDRFGSDTEDSSRSGKPHYTSVSSFSSSSSMNVNGHNVNHKTAETVVNRDGKVTKYRVQD